MKKCYSKSNEVLKALSPADFMLLKPHLSPVDLPVRTSLEHRHKAIESVYFIETGVASVVSGTPHEVELAIIGKEGMTGVSLVLASEEEAPFESYMQVAGSGLRIASADLRHAIDQSVPLHRVLLRCAHSFLKQATENSLGNVLGSMEQRLARWLLMVNDRLEGNEIPLTHEFMGIMLGVHRSGMTLAVQELERMGAIGQRRARIDILDRSILEEMTEEIYANPNPVASSANRTAKRIAFALE